MPDIECEHCGGTDFYKEAGFFFCKGCQIQSQEVQEYVFDDFAAENRPKSKKVHSEKKEKADNKITSWECYNYILLGLTEELINLGADKTLKSVVKILWLRYLEKLQVFKLGEDRLPKLQAVCSEIDGEVVYGKVAKVKRKRRKSSSSESKATTVASSSITHERMKKKRALVKAQYEDFSQKSQGTPSLHNETLVSLQTTSDKSSKKAAISYNIYATREMRRIKKSKFHWHRHRTDFDHNLKCHKISYRKISHKYRKSSYILSLNKIYAILYLGLLIIKSKIQLSDVLRFIREGHLSFNCYSHFFPEEFCDKTLNFRNFKKNSVFANGPLRFTASEMSIFLGIEYYIGCPNLVELCERYCKEMNLPLEICDCAKNIMSKADINMTYRKRLNKVPNYEGRVLSIILFVIKLLFGLDDVTEFHLAKYSEILNSSDLINPKMFNIVEWLKYIEYRDLVMTHEHFPTNFSNDNNIRNVNLALSVLAKKEYPQEQKVNVNKDKYKQVLKELKNELAEPESTEFPVTLTPYLDYVKVVPKFKYLQILSKNFYNDSLIHILQPVQFLEVVNKDEPDVVHKGANEDWILEKLFCPKQRNHQNLKEKRKLITVKLSFNSFSKPETETEEFLDPGSLKESFDATNESIFQRNARRLLNKSFTSTDFDFDKIKKELKEHWGEYCTHYNPHERFWLRTRFRIEDNMSQKKCRQFLETFPYNFRLVFKECQRIAQQSEQEFLAEYQFTELCLVYLANYGKKSEKRKVMNTLVTKYLNSYANYW